MRHERAASAMLRHHGVEESTMMKSPCLRYKGSFIAMMFDKEDTLIIKVTPDRVNELISSGKDQKFNFTKKRFKEWVLIPLEFQDEYEAFLNEALNYAKIRDKSDA